MKKKERVIKREIKKECEIKENKFIFETEKSKIKRTKNDFTKKIDLKKCRKAKGEWKRKEIDRIRKKNKKKGGTINGKKIYKNTTKKVLNYFENYEIEV